MAFDSILNASRASGNSSCRSSYIVPVAILAMWFRTDAIRVTDDLRSIPIFIVGKDDYVANDQ